MESKRLSWLACFVTADSFFGVGFSLLDPVVDFGI